jgi:hypothetical protein
VPGLLDAPQRVLRRLGRADRRILAFLALGPFLAYVPFSLAGHPIMPGDDLLQNFPLRVLSGKLIASGRLPVWDPLIWSGTPLLGGWNAGSMFPGTWLFAFLPSITAWTINFAAIPAAASIGCFLFLRRALSLRPIPAFAASLIFTYTGFVGGQTVHIGLEQGTAVVPFMLLGIDGAGRATNVRQRVGYALLIGMGFALSVLAGDPRAVSNAAFICIVYVLALAIRLRRRCVALLVNVIAGLCLGIVASAVQWLPGLAFLGSSQRQGSGYIYFGGGSLTIFQQIANFLVPFLSGTNANFGQPVYSGYYNLPEVTIGVGLVALVATAAFLPEVVASIAAWIRRRPSPRSHRLGVWYVLLILGIALAAGSTTPFGHVVYEIPLLGGERLQNRNILLSDLALSVLLGYFLNDLLEANDHATDRDGRLSWWHRSGTAARLLGVLPSLGVVVLVAYALADPASLQHHLSFPVPDPSLFRSELGYLICSIAVALVLGHVVFHQRRLTRKTLIRVVCILVACDFLTYVLNTGLATTPSKAVGGPTATSRAIAARVGPSGRFAIYNPVFFTPVNGEHALTEAGIPDVNIVQNTLSIQGYGSIVDNNYANATGAHNLEGLDASRLSSQTFATLDLKYLLTLPLYLAIPITAHSPIPVVGAAPGSAPKDTPSLIGTPPQPWQIGPGKSADFFLPSPSTLIRATVVVTSAHATSLTVSESGSGMKPLSTTGPVTDGQFYESLPARHGETLVVVSNPTATWMTVGAVVVVTHNPDARLVLSGALQAGLSSPQWEYAGKLGSFVELENTETHGLGWLQPNTTATPETETLAEGSVRLLNSSSLAPQRFVVNATAPAEFVRSETYEPGWRATLTSTATGKSKSESVERFGLVQMVRVPAGRYIVTWHYQPHDLLIGFGASVGGTAVVVVALAYLILARRRNDLSISQMA